MRFSNAQCSHDSPSSDGGAAGLNIVKDVPENDNMDDLTKELASLCLDDEPPRHDCPL